MPQRHSEQKIKNTAALTEAKIPFVSANRGEALLIRVGNFRVDFFPSTCKTMLHRQGKEPEIREWDAIGNVVNWLKQMIANAEASMPKQAPTRSLPKPPPAPPAKSNRVIVFKPATKKR